MTCSSVLCCQDLLYLSHPVLLKAPAPALARLLCLTAPVAPACAAARPPAPHCLGFHTAALGVLCSAGVVAGQLPGQLLMGMGLVPQALWLSGTCSPSPCCSVCASPMAPSSSTLSGAF